MNASPAPVVSTSSSGGIFSAVPRNSLPLSVPIPLAFSLAVSDETHVGSVAVESDLCFRDSTKLSMSISLDSDVSVEVGNPVKG